MAGQGEIDKRLIVAIIIAAVGLVMLISGSVMLGIGVHKAKQKSNCPKCQTCSTPVVCPQLSPTAVFTSSYDNSIKYSSDLDNPNSTLFKNTAASLSQNITTALNGPVPAKASMSVAVTGTVVTINSFQASSNGVGVNFYASIIFPYDGMSSDSVQTQMNTLYPTNASPSSTAQCNSLVPPPGEPISNQSSTSTKRPTTTMAIPSPTPTYPLGVYCDASSSNLLQVFLIDCAIPTDGTLDDKLSTIRTFLNTYDQAINLHNASNWGNVGFQYVVYNGDLYAPSQICYDDACWHTQVDALTLSIVNPNEDASHFLSNGLKTVSTSVFPANGQARNLLILSDGFDITDNNYVFWSNTLKSQNYQIGAYLVSSNNYTRSVFDHVISSIEYRYYVNDWYWLLEPTVIGNMARWSCGTTFPTPPPTNPPITPPLLPTTSKASTTFRPPMTTPSGPTPVPNCVVNVLFLVDESLSTIKSNGYNQSLNYARSLAQQISQSNNASTFAIITFNSNIVYQSPSYVNYTAFLAQVDSIPFLEGSTNFIIGFNASRQFIATNSNYAADGIRSLLIFLSDGFSDNSTSIITVQQISYSLRSIYSTEIIALGLVEDTFAQSLTKEAIDYGVDDGFVQSQYIDVANLASLPSSQTLNLTVNSITCKIPTQVDCSTDFIIVIEVSEGETDGNIEVERATVNLLLSHYKSIIGASKGEVSLIYFSAPDGLQGIEYNRSGILYEMLDNVDAATDLLNRKDFHPLGGASDVNLAMKLILQVLDYDLDNNDQLVLFFGRGEYADAPNCCSDPSDLSAVVRSKATMQGIVIGTYPNMAKMNNFTGSQSIDGNALVKLNSNQTDVNQSAQAILAALIPIIDNHLASVYCAPIPILNPPCNQYDDIVLILHANSASNWDIVKQFVNQLVIPSLTGPISNIKQSPGMYVNLVVITYFGQTVNSINSFAEQYSTAQIVSVLNSTIFISTANTTNSLSSAYKEASIQLSDARQLSSKTVLVITDTVDIADYESAIVQRNKMPYSFVFGMKLNAQEDDIVPGQDEGTKVSDIQQINPANPRPAIALANIAYDGVCRNVPITTIAPAPTPKPTPGPIPKVKARNLWPDVTILIDAAQQDKSLFEMQRQFIQNTFLNQFKIGDSWSRFTIATYNNATNVVCRFIDITTYWDLYECLGNQLSYNGSVNNNIQKRDIGQALTTISNSLYFLPSMGDTGYKPLKSNYLYILTNGDSSSDFYIQSTILKSQGIQVIGIDISVSSEMTPQRLTDFGPDSYSVPRFSNQVINDQLSQAIIQQNTVKQRPILSKFFSDFYFIVDNSLSQAVNLPNVQAFVTKFYEQLTISPHRSRLSIVPYSNALNSPLKLTDNSTVVDNFLRQWKASPAGANASSVTIAINYVKDTILENPTRTSHVIYIVGSTTTDGAASASKIQNIAGTNSFALNYNAVNYSLVLTGDPSRAFMIQDSSSLLSWSESQFPVDVRGRNPMNAFFNTLLDVQETADFNSFPTKEVTADIMIFLDETGLTEDDFSSLKQYLVNFTNQFTVGFQDTQFALQAFSAQIIPEAGWHFNDNRNNEYITQRINNLTLTNSSATASADLAGAVEQALFYFLQPAYGWREGAATYSIIITNAKNFSFGSNSSDTITSLQSKSSVLAISLNGNISEYVQSWVNTGFNEATANPQSLNTQVGVGLDLTTFINTSYKKLIYPPLPDIGTLAADFIFLIDSTNLTDALMPKNFLLKFLFNVGDSNYSRASVINYNSQGVVQDQSWTLRKFAVGDRVSLINAIKALNFTSDPSAPDLVSAVAYFSAIPSLFGVDSKTPVYVISLFNSPTIQSPLSSAVMNEVNLDYFTYTIQYNGKNQPFDYLPSFLGKDYAEDFVYVNDLTTYDITASNVFYPLNTYIQSEYVAFQNSYVTNN